MGRQRLLYVGPLRAARLHCHHAFQVVVSPTTFTLYDAAGRRSVTRAAAIPPDVAHGIEHGAERAALLFVLPEYGRRERMGAGAADCALSWSHAGRALAGYTLPSPLAVEDYDETAERILALLVGTPARDAAPLHPAVERALTLIQRDAECRAAPLAAASQISESRLCHLFREQVGVPLRPYVRWVRLQRAAEALMRGANLTEAAHAAGFSDSAHLSNTFRRTFGVAPSDVSASVQWLAGLQSDRS